MCDTLVHRNPEEGRTLFAKNSDRDPGEPQLIHYCGDPVSELENDPFDEPLAKYSDGPFLRLKGVFGEHDNRYGALLSRPSWIWGAEMGLNECGVSIGNEAVFSKEQTASDGLLGMDILRLALHNAPTAPDALEFIIGIIEKHGQGGNGSYRGKLTYHNSFIITDRSASYVLETSGKHWAWKKVERNASISNAYSLRGDFDRSDSKSRNLDFKGHYENRLFTFFAKGDRRQSRTTASTDGETIRPEDMKQILRSHRRAHGKIPRGMDSVCMHSRGIVKSETTSSLIIDYLKDRRIIWYTGSPYPCVSLFKPLVLTEKTKKAFSHRESVLASCRRNRALAETLLNHPLFEERIRELRDQTEQRMRNIIYDRADEKTEEEFSEDLDRCGDLEDGYYASVADLLDLN